MFGIGKKERAAEAVRRGVLASLTGAYLHHSEIERLGLNKSASSWLYTESLAHHVYALGTIFSHALSSAERWATQEFFVTAAESAFAAHESKNGLAPGTLSSVIFPRFGEFQSLRGEQRVAGEHYAASASAVRARDSKADTAAVHAMLRESTDRYVADARRMFGV
jgi:hypothetical protein